VGQQCFRAYSRVRYGGGKHHPRSSSPTTTKIKGYPFEVRLSGTPASVVLADQVKSLDWRARKAVKKGRAIPAELAEIRSKLHALIG
jgi:mRNA interferase MazF